MLFLSTNLPAHLGAPSLHHRLDVLTLTTQPVLFLSRNCGYLVSAGPQTLTHVLSVTGDTSFIISDDQGKRLDNIYNQ